MNHQRRSKKQRVGSHSRLYQRSKSVLQSPNALERRQGLFERKRLLRSLKFTVHRRCAMPHVCEGCELQRHLAVHLVRVARATSPPRRLNNSCQPNRLPSCLPDFVNSEREYPAHCCFQASKLKNQDRFCRKTNQMNYQELKLYYGRGSLMYDFG